MPTHLERCSGALLGLACGDAVGTTVEFMSRGSFTPVTDMVGGGPFRLAAGQWTDDTSMALCLAESLIAKGGFDATDQMGRYLNWWHWGYLVRPEQPVQAQRRAWAVGIAPPRPLSMVAAARPQAELSMLVA